MLVGQPIVRLKGRALRVAAILLCVFSVPVAAQSEAETGTEATKAELQAVLPDLEAAISDVRRGVWIHSGSVIGGVLFPPAWPIGTSVGSQRTLQGATSYRDTVTSVLDKPPFPSLTGARVGQIVGVAGHTVATAAFVALIGFAIVDIDPTIDMSREVQIAGATMAGGLVTGIAGTTFATWRARNVTLRFHGVLDLNLTEVSQR